MDAQSFNFTISAEILDILQAKAKNEGKSLDQLISEFVDFGILVETLTDQNSKVVIRKPKGVDEAKELIIPLPGKMVAI
jgi:hypothetical protein